MQNLPLKLTHEHAILARNLIEVAVGQARGALRALGYEDDVIEFEIALMFAQQAARFGIDLLATRSPQPVVVKPTNGHNPP